ncbi:Peroxidase [Rhynchospora pubera]|uniref:Peroxidase n=1 Tax=Rhynchospora pubera TaxID=906938 RepID=A0AAV8EU34_9POAL|nr:Peroxidase [Rhynchospora pubera]
MATQLERSIVAVSLLTLIGLLCMGGWYAENQEGNQRGALYPQFYDASCPNAKEIVESITAQAVSTEARMAASLLRLHYHDCFVKVFILYNPSFSLSLFIF